MILFLLCMLFSLSLLLYFYFSKNTSIINLNNVFILSIIILSFITVIYIYNDVGFLRIDNGKAYSDESYLKYMIYVMLTLLFLFPVYLYYKIKKPLVECIGQVKYSPLSNKRENLIIILSILVSAPLIFFISDLIFQYGFSGYIANRIILLKGNGYLVSLIKFPQIAIGIVFYNLLYKKLVLKTSISKMKITILVIYSMFLASIMGSRTQMFIPIISMLIIYMIIKYGGKVKITNIKKPMLIMLSIIFIAISLGQVREQVMSGQKITFQNKDSFTDKVIYSFGSIENLLWLFDHDKPNDFEYGKTFLAALTGFIPRAVWPDKLLGGGPLMKDLISSGSYDLSSGENISSTTTGIITESYINFSWFGVIFPALLLILLNFLLNFLRFLTPAVYMSFYFYFILSVSAYASSEFFGVTSHLFIYIVAAIFFDLIIRMLNGKIILFR